MIGNHLLVLQVVIPLLLAPVCVLTRRGVLAWSIAIVASWASLAISLLLLFKVADAGPMSYRIGDWAAPWGIEYSLDLVGAFVLTIVSAIGAIVLPYAKKSVEREIPHDRIYLFYTMLLLCMAGLLGIVVTGDAFNLFVFLEVSSLSTYVLISLGRDRRALTAAYRYLIMGTIGATFYIIGVGLMYMATGTLNMADLSTILPAVMGSRTVLVALAFLTVGISLKLALFPLHAWLPNAYAFAPSVVTVFLAATATKVAAYALLRIYFTVFGGVAIFEIWPIHDTLMVLALAGIFAASIVAIYQEDVKRLLAYSSVAQIGYIVLGISFFSITGVSGGILHLFNHALMKGALFMALGIVAYRIGSTKLHDMSGIAKRMPLTMAAFVGAGLSLIGVPLTVGFVSKWVLISAALEQDQWPIAALVLVSSLLAVIYVWRVVEIAYFRPAPETTSDTPSKYSEAPLSMLIPTWAMVGACIVFGVTASWSVNTATLAAAALMGAGH